MKFSPLAPETSFARSYGHCNTVDCGQCICPNRVFYVMQKFGISATQFLTHHGKGPPDMRDIDTELLTKINEEIRTIPRHGEIIEGDPDDAEEHVYVRKISPPPISDCQDRDL